MVGSSVNGAETVSTRIQSVGNLSGERVATRIQSLEEGELARVGRLRLGDGSKLLNDNVRVTLDISGLVNLLRSREIGFLCIGEVTSLEMLELELDSEGLVGLNFSIVQRELELARGNVGGGGDDSHGSRVAGTTLDLLAVSEGLIGGKTEVDKVVRGSQGSDLTSGGPKEKKVGNFELRF